MRRIKSSQLGLDQGTAVLFSDYQHDGNMWTGDGAREMRHAVEFDEPFNDAPIVQVGISMWDFDKDTNQRADISAEDVTGTGFTIVFKTWGDTRIARIRADWTAMGTTSNEDDWELY